MSRSEILDAVLSRDLVMLEYLLQNTTENIQDAIDYAFGISYIYEIHNIFEYLFNVVNITKKRFAFSWACSQNNFHMVKYILKRHPNGMIEYKNYDVVKIALLDDQNKMALWLYDNATDKQDLMNSLSSIFREQLQELLNYRYTSLMRELKDIDALGNQDINVLGIIAQDVAPGGKLVEPYYLEHLYGSPVSRKGSR